VVEQQVVMFQVSSPHSRTCLGNQSTCRDAGTDRQVEGVSGTRFEVGGEPSGGCRAAAAGTGCSFVQQQVEMQAGTCVHVLYVCVACSG
jgi:hypothetical protein